MSKLLDTSKNLNPFPGDHLCTVIFLSELNDSPKILIYCGHFYKNKDSLIFALFPFLGRQFHEEMTTYKFFILLNIIGRVQYISFDIINKFTWIEEVSHCNQNKQFSSLIHTNSPITRSRRTRRSASPDKPNAG